MLNNSNVAVGYVRVSSDLQAKDPSAIKRQVEKLQHAAQANGYVLEKVFEEVASAVPDDQLEKRKILLEAVAMAKRLNAPLFITEPTRLFRNERVAVKFLAEEELRIFSAAVGRILKSSEIGKAVRRGAKSAANIQAGTKKALANNAREAMRNAKEYGAMGRAASLLTQQAKKDALNDRIIQLMQDHPECNSYTHQEFADWLNKLGVRTYQGKVWSKASIAKKRPAIASLIAKREREKAGVVAPLSVPVPGERKVDENDDDELEKLRKLPHFDIFNQSGLCA